MKHPIIYGAAMTKDGINHHPIKFTYDPEFGNYYTINGDVFQPHEVSEGINVSQGTSQILFFSSIHDEVSAFIHGAEKAATMLATQFNNMCRGFNHSEWSSRGNTSIGISYVRKGFTKSKLEIDDDYEMDEYEYELLKKNHDPDINEKNETRKHIGKFRRNR